MNNDPCMNQELAYNIISLQNQVKELKDKCQNEQKIIKDLKEKAITKELLDTLYPTNLAFKSINFNKKGAFLDNEKSVQYGPYKKYEEGKYCIIYYGENLTKVSFDCCDNKGKNLIKISMLYQFSDKAAYDVFLPKNNECIEFRAKRKNKKTLIKEFRHKGEKGIKKLRAFIQETTLIKKIEVYRYNNC